MPENTHNQTTASNKSDQNERNGRTGQLRRTATRLDPYDRRSSTRQLVTPIEHAMDIALGCKGEIWERRQRAWRDQRIA